MYSMARALLAHSHSTLVLLLLLPILLLPSVLSAPLLNDDKDLLIDINLGPYEPTDLNEAENLKVVGASVVTVPQNIKSTITCTVETDVDPEYIKTYWFKQVSILGSSHEWRRQQRSTFSAGTMSMTITLRKRTFYKCKACVTMEPVAFYKRSFSGGDRCHETVVEVRARHQ